MPNYTSPSAAYRPAHQGFPGTLPEPAKPAPQDRGFIYSLLHAPHVGLTYGKRYALDYWSATPMDESADVVIVDDQDEAHTLLSGHWSFLAPLENLLR